MEDYNLSITEAMQHLYNSQVFTKLNDQETGLYRESSLYIYDLYKSEKENGKVIQEEI